MRIRNQGARTTASPSGTAAMFAHELQLTREIEHYTRCVFSEMTPHKNKLSRLIRLQDHLDKVRAEIGSYAAEKGCLIDFATSIMGSSKTRDDGFEIEARWRPLIHEYEAAKRTHQQNPWSFLE